VASEHVSQTEILRKNISAIAEVQRKETEARTLQDRIADAITTFSGSMAFVYFHAVWFGLWILLNVNIIHIPHLSEFDPFPFGLLTMIVSLEAIFLATFVLISQNRLARVSDRRADLDLHVNLLAEQKATKVLELLDNMARQLDAMSSHYTFTPDPEVDALKVSPAPQDVLEVIEQTVKEETEMVRDEMGRAVKEISSETHAVRADVAQLSDEMEEVVEDVREIKEELKK
jgi:uncharacterized membrane protein